METEERRIEIFAPCEAALDRMKLILFQPFDLAKWCVIGFAAFLANLGGGGMGNGFNYNSKAGNGNWSFRSVTDDARVYFESIPTWLIIVIGIVVVAFIALVVGLTWLGARGKFIFTDCVVRNRGAIVEPWKEFKREGNSLFLFRLATGLIFLLLLGLVALPLWWPLVRHGVLPEGMTLVVGLVLLVCVFVFTAFAWAGITVFIVPIMYRRRCGALQGLREAFGLVMNAPGPIVLFLLFSVVLWVAIALAACVTTCLTCCVAAIPYVGTVILLPLYVFWMSYLLLFVRQFGPAYDVWADLAAVEVTVPPIQIESAPSD